MVGGFSEGSRCLKYFHCGRVLFDQGLVKVEQESSIHSRE